MTKSLKDLSLKHNYEKCIVQKIPPSLPCTCQVIMLTFSYLILIEWLNQASVYSKIFLNSDIQLIQMKDGDNSVQYSDELLSVKLSDGC